MGRSHPLRDLGLAFTQLTVVPLPVRWPDDGTKPDLAGYYPVVGLAIGASQYAVMLLARPGTVMVYVVALLAVACGAALTRGMHWDGLADVADAFGGWSRERRLEIMKDSALGTFGTLALGFGIGVEVMALASLAGTNGLLLVPAAVGLSRFAATFAAWIGKPARPDGLGAAVCRRPGAVGLAAGLVTLAGLTYWMWLLAGRGGLIVAGAALASALVVPDLLSRRFGGVTGDVLGASILLCELVSFSVLVVMFGA